MGARAKLMLLAIAHAITTAKHTDTGGLEDSLLNGVSVVSYQPLGDVTNGDYMNSHVVVSNGDAFALSFSPPKLTFGARPLGMPHIERVTIMNKLNRTVHLTSISGHTTHFHSSFFEDKSIPPNGNTSFNVVFLGRMEGPVDTCLFIHTSEGIHKYMMSGVSTPSAYRLQPLMRIFLPYNASYSSLIHMHNPHDYPIQVTEVYSSGGNVVLELPGGGLEGPQTLWLLPPHTTRPVITVRYNPPLIPSVIPHQLPVRDKESPTHLTAYVRIKLHGTASVLSSVLVVAVEIFTATEPGPYTVPQFIDFGLGGTRDSPKKVRLFMGNSSPKPIRISTITIDNAELQTNGGIRILTTAKMLLPPFSPPDIHVATIILNWKQAFDSGQCCGKIIISTKQDYSIEIPFTSEPLSGGLVMNDESVTRYLSSESGITVIRQVLLKNTFKVGVYATELILGKGIDKYFEISAFYPQDFKVNTIQHGFRIQLKSWTKSLKFESKLTIVTNISSQVIPVYIYNGKLDIVASVPPRPSNKGVLDLGLVGVSSTTRATLVLRNSNPVPICVRGSGADLPGTAIQLLGCSAQSPSALELASGSTSNVTACTCIPAKWCAILVVSVVAPASAASLRGEFWVATVHERLIVPVALTAANGGRLSQPEPSNFKDCFPGTLCSFQLQIKSTFPVDMDVVSVEAVPYDRRLFYKTFSSSTIIASALSKIGWLHYDPYLLCDGKCYTGLDVNSTVGQQWLSRMSLPDDTLDLDFRLFNSRYNLFLNLTSVSTSMNLSIRLDTTQVRNHMLSTRIPFIWPTLQMSPITILTPLSQVGLPSYYHFKITNPSQTRPLIVQLVFDWMLNNNDSIVMPESLRQPGVPSERYTPSSSSSSSSSSSERAFFFPSFVITDEDSEFCSDDKSMESCYNIETWQNDNLYWLPTFVLPHPESRLFMLPPGGEKNITVAFLANSPKKVSSVLYIRNNLTIVETLRLNGEGVIASLKFGNRKPGSITPLLFDITEKHLKDCDRDKNKKVSSPPNFTVKRTFVARNTGVIPIKITRFFINSMECEGYGFRVLNCEPFELFPNGTHKVDIAFTPDFTLTKVQRLLILETSLTDFVNYTLVSSIPVSLASKCAAILRRPPWEVRLHNIASSLLIGIGFCVLFAGCYESYKILTLMSTSHVRETNMVHAPFDLRTIGQIGLNKKPETWDCCPDTPEVKSKDNYKVSNWNYTDNILNSDESKSNTHSQKCEDTSQGTTIRNRKKLSKKNSNSSETTTQDFINDHDINTKEKRSSKDLASNHSSWKGFTRNSVVNVIKTGTKNSPEPNEISKSSLNPTQDTIVDKNDKSQEIRKKLPSIFNVGNDNADSNNQHSYSNNNKKQSKSKCTSTVQIHGCEEDTSSTTTESSNNDDADKENDNSSPLNKTPGSNNKKSHNGNSNKKSKYASHPKDSCNGDGDEEEYDIKTHNNHSPHRNENNPKWAKNKENLTSSHNAKISFETDKQKSFDQSKLNIHNYENPTISKTAKKETNKSNQKKERQLQSKKRSIEKSFIFTAKSDNNTNLHSTSSFNMARSSPSTPPAVSTVWENRASFSDVVARNENSCSGNFVNQHKDIPEPRKPDQKSSVIGNNIQTHNINKYSNEDGRKLDSQVKSNADLGPIGHWKKPNWSSNLTDSQPKQYLSNIQQNGPHAQNISEDINPVNNNSYFLNNSYYNNQCLSDLAAKNNLNMSNHTTNPVSYGTIGSVNTVGSNNIPRMQYNIGNSAFLQNLNQNSSDNVNSQTTSNVNSYNYGMRLSSPVNCNMLDFSPNSDLMNLASNMSLLNANNSPIQMSSINSYDTPINSWDRLSSDSLNASGHVNNIPNLNNDSMFETDYNNARSFYDDNKIGWSTSPQNVWNHLSPTSTTTTVQNSQILTTNTSQVPPTNSTNNISSSDRGPAEWLWGYDNNNTSNNTNSSNTSNLSTTNVSSNQSYNMNQYPQSSQMSPQQTMSSFDSFPSLSTIWSTGPPRDLWTNQQNYDGNIQDLNSLGHNNHYQ